MPLSAFPRCSFLVFSECCCPNTQEASWRGMREEAARLQEHVTQLEHILSTKCVESVRVVPALQEVRIVVGTSPSCELGMLSPCSFLFVDQIHELE